MRLSASLLALALPAAIHAQSLDLTVNDVESDDDGPMGRLRGVTISSFNQVKGEQFGLSIGLVNYAWELNGVQVGLINYARSNRKGLRLLPLFNAEFR